MQRTAGTRPPWVRCQPSANPRRRTENLPVFSGALFHLSLVGRSGTFRMPWLGVGPLARSGTGLRLVRSGSRGTRVPKGPSSHPRADARRTGTPPCRRSVQCPVPPTRIELADHRSENPSAHTSRATTACVRRNGRAERWTNPAVGVRFASLSGATQRGGDANVSRPGATQPDAGEMAPSGEERRSRSTMNRLTCLEVPGTSTVYLALTIARQVRTGFPRPFDR